MKHLFLLSAAAVATLAGTAHAQLVVGNDDLTGGTPPNAWHVDLSTCSSMLLWSGIEAWGLAADDAGGVIYVADGTVLQSWAYNSPNPPVTVGSFTSSVDGAVLSTVGLAWANGTLYSSRTISSTTNPEGIYTVDHTTGVATLAMAVPSADYDLGGIGYNPADGLFYGTNDDSSPFGAGVFSIDVLGAGAITFVTAYDGGEIDVDGCTVGNGKVFAITDDAGDPLYNYDLATGTWDPNPCTSPMPTTELFSGAAWAPGLASGGCAQPFTYCTGKTNSAGCVPQIGWIGTPDAGGSGQFDVTQSNHVPGKFGLLFYSKSGPNNAPFQGGTLCAAPPLRRTPGSFSSGSGACGGVHTFDFNARIASGVDPALVAGQRVWAQWYGRDVPGSPSLSDGLEFEICL